MKKMYKILTLLTVVLFGLHSGSSAQLTNTFSYTGGVQSYSVPLGVSTITLNAEGAVGGKNSDNVTFPNAVGRGGCVTATYTVTPGQIYYIYVGEAGKDGKTSGVPSPGGFNGGGAGAFFSSISGGGGGGASDVRLGGSALSDRILVAGGGGGAGFGCGSDILKGGDGGALTGQNANSGTGTCPLGPISPVTATGGTQVAGGTGGNCTACGSGCTPACPSGITGSFGFGGNGGAGSPGGGGGAGYYGGGGGRYGGGGGGSNFIHSSAIATLKNSSGCHPSGNGIVTMTVTCAPTTITATKTTICAGDTLTLVNSISGGTWTTGDASIATIGSTSGIVTGTPSITGGVVVMTYHIGPCTKTITLTINPSPDVITGAADICHGLKETLSDATPLGTWSSSGAVSVDPLGELTAVTPGTGRVTYTLPTSCFTTTTMTVNPLPTPILGTTVVCSGLTSTLSDLTPLGTWSNANSAVSTIDAGGTVTGVTTGVIPEIDTITYTITATGCKITTTFTVNPLPSAINGVTSVCQGATTGLSDPTPGGTWTSGNTGVATVDPTGLVFGVSPGTSTITYTITTTGCIATAIVSVNPLPVVYTVGPTTATHYCAGFSGIPVTLSNSDLGIKYVLYQGATVVDSLPGLPGALSYGDRLQGTYNIIGIDTTLATYCSSIMSGPAVIIEDPIPAPITGTTTLCMHTTTVVLADADAGGVWTSSNTDVAIIGTAGDITTASTHGTSVITYTFPTTGCLTTTTLTVYPNYDIYGIMTACAGDVITLFDTSDAGAGTWSGVGVTVVGAGTTATVTGPVGSGSVSYTSAMGCVTTTVVTWTVADPITGPNTVCVGGTITLSNINAGGIWTSVFPAVATVGSSTGTVTGISGGTTGTVDTIVYTLPSGCRSTLTITVNPLPNPIAGPSTVCEGATMTLSDAYPGGTWASTNTLIATIDPTGLVTGVLAGVDTIIYTLPTTCSTMRTITVNPLPAPITGTTVICEGYGTQLFDITTPGTWSSSNIAVAVIDASGNILGGGTLGTSTITYTLPTGCYDTINITYSPTPDPITGKDTVCALSSVTLSTTSTGGAWSSLFTTVATVTAGGVVTGQDIGGIDSIIYTSAAGCRRTYPIFVHRMSNIYGPASICVGQTVTLTNLATGGTWSSSTTAVSIDPVTGVVTALAAGSTVIKDTFANGCFVTTPLLVNPAAGPITGPGTVCSRSTITLSDAGGGTWASGNTLVATVSGTGVVTGVNPGGLVTITYTLPLTGCAAVKTVTVYPLDTVIGPHVMCDGTIVTLTNATLGGGTWSSGTTSVAVIGSLSGTVTSAPPAPPGGTTIISFTTARGCVTTHTMTVIVVSPITGTANVCVGSTRTFSSATGGGTWSTASTALSVGSSTGIVTGITTPGGVITYTAPSGCFTVLYVAVYPLPAAITGVLDICEGTTSPLSDATSGGTWLSSAPAIGSIDNITGVVGGVSGGTATITYQLTSLGSCFITASLNVRPIAPITGTMSTCIGQTTALTNAIGGGTWASSNIVVAPITSPGGVVTGGASGTATITYTNPGGCEAYTTVTVYSLPAAITGTFKICQSSSTTLSNAIIGGGWTSSNGAVATITSPGGVMTGTGGGTATITYSLGTGCYATQQVTVEPITPILTAPFRVCDGSTITLSNATGGGTWQSSNTAIADIGSTTGVVTTNAVGTTIISYTITTGLGCRATQVVTVNPLPDPISGPTEVCAGSSITLSSGTTTGGVWSTTPSPIPASVTPVTGVVTGGAVVTSTAATIIYTLPTTCTASYTVTVNPIPLPITGIAAMCVALGNTVTLTTASTGGSWSSTDVSIGTVDPFGVVTSTGVVGTTTISYTFSSTTGCASTRIVSVNPFPSLTTGPTTVCTQSTITLSNPSPGGTWMSMNTAIATVGSLTGVVYGVLAGTVNIDYTLPTTCNAMFTVTVLPQPSAVVTALGDTTICPGAFVALTGTTGPLLTYQWYRSTPTGGSVLIAGANLASYIASPAPPPPVTDSFYYVTITGANGCSDTSRPIQVSVIPTSASLSSSPPSGTACAGTPIVLTAAGTPPVTGYQWEDAVGPISGATAITYTPTVNGTYYVVVTNGAGCSAKSSGITVKINPVPSSTTTVVGTSPICVGDSMVISAATGTGYTYQWYNGVTLMLGATNSSYTAKGVGSFSVAVTNSFGCTARSGVTAVATNPLPTGLSILVSGSTTICVGGSGVNLAALPGTAGTPTFQWYQGSTPIIGATGSNLLVSTAGTFKALVTDGVTGCKAFTPTETTKLITPPVVVPLTSASFCWGGSAVLKATVVSGIPITYEWFKNATLITGATGNTYAATTAGAYSVKVTSGCSVTSSSLTVIENPLPNPIITFDATFFRTSASFVSYQWYKNLVAIPGATGATLKATGNGDYKVAVVDTNGCQSFSNTYVLTGWTPGVGTGVNNQTLAKGEVRIYPNPAQNTVHIESADEVRAVITSIDGRMLIKQAHAKDIDISNLANGIYNIMLYDVSGQMIKAEKLVKSAE